MPSEPRAAERQPSHVEASVPRLHDALGQVPDAVNSAAGKPVIETGLEKGPPGSSAPHPSGGIAFVSSEEWAVISSAIERSKSYPRMARERGIQGVTKVRFRLKQSGEVEKVEIVKSSGSDILDSASVRTVYRAGPMPYIDGWVEVPIAYVLE